MSLRRRPGLLALLFALITIVLGGEFLWWMSGISSPVYAHALRTAQRDVRVTTAFGGVPKAQWGVNDFVRNRVARGEAQLVVPLEGPLDSGTLRVHASLREGVWVYSLLQVEVRSTGGRIDLLTATTVPGT